MHSDLFTCNHLPSVETSAIPIAEYSIALRKRVSLSVMCFRSLREEYITMVITLAGSRISRNGSHGAYSSTRGWGVDIGNLPVAIIADTIVVRHTDGTPLYYIAQIEDINDLKHTEWINKRLMERITLANEAGGIGIWEWDLTNDVISWDKRMFELYDVPPHTKPTYQLWLDRLVKEDLPHSEAVIRESLKNRLPFKLEFRMSCPY